MQGTITKSTGSWYQVLTVKGNTLQGRIRGKLRLDNLDTSNPIAVGDLVEYDHDPGYPDTAFIQQILPRKNHIIRRSNKLSSKRQVLASNLDYVVIVASIVSPRTSLGFIDRTLVCCEAFHIPAVLFFNKSDLLDSEGLEIAAEMALIYQNIGYPVFIGSALENAVLRDLRALISGKTVLELGHSGAGKSTLLNQLFPAAAAKVDVISDYHEKGKHTTTFAEMHLMPDGTRFIDTPGIRDFGVVDVPENEIGQYFPEFRKFSLNCKFNDCQHTNEPDCAIKDAVERGDISQERYYSYNSILRGEDVFE